MSNTSNLIGEIANPTPVIDRVVGDPELGEDCEKFYSVEVEFKGFKIPVLVSEFKLDTIIRGKVKIVGSLFSDYVPGQLPRFYIFANEIKPTDPDMELTNKVNFSGTITKVKPSTTDAAGRDVVPMVLSSTTPLNSANVLFLNLKNRNARAHKDRKPKFQVRGFGYIKPFRDIYEIYVDTIEVL